MSKCAMVSCVVRCRAFSTIALFLIASVRFWRWSFSECVKTRNVHLCIDAIKCNDVWLYSRVYAIKAVLSWTPISVNFIFADISGCDAACGRPLTLRKRLFWDMTKTIPRSPHLLFIYIQNSHIRERRTQKIKVRLNRLSFFFCDRKWNVLKNDRQSFSPHI